MKALILLIVIQTGVLLLMFGKIVAIEKEMAPAMPSEHNTLASDGFSGKQSQETSGEAFKYLNEARMRLIVREELAAQLAILPGADVQKPAIIAADPIDQAEYQYQFESVTQKLGIYESIGSISDSDMQALQSEIMMLNEADRVEALSRLVRAMNAGTLKGRL